MQARLGHRWIPLALGVLVPVLVGCDSSDGDSDAGNVIRIGYFRDPTGDGVDAVLAAREINAGGGIEIDGKPFQLDLVLLPHNETPAGAVAAVEEFVDRGVVAAVGPPWSSLVLGEKADHSDGAARAAIDSGLVLVSANATSSEISDLDDDGYVWRTIPSDDLQGPAGAKFAYGNRDGRRAAVLYRDDPYGIGLSTSFAREFEALGGEVVAKVAYDTQGDLGRSAFPELADVFADMPDTVYVVAFEELAQIGNRVLQEGYLEPYGDMPPQFLATDGAYFPSILGNTPPEVLEHLAGTVPGPDPKNEGFQHFLERYVAEGLGPEGNAWPYAYDAVYVIALAIQSAGSADPAKFKRHMQRISIDEGGDVAISVDQWAKARKALLAGKGVDYDGASGPIDFTDAGDPGHGRFSLWTVTGSPSAGFTFDDSMGVEF